ncbi:MAG: nucleotide exchange factor GrpE [Terriglobia bacterium]
MEKENDAPKTYSSAAGEGREGKPAEAEQTPAEDLAATCQKLQAEKQELYDRLLRKQAEFDNYRKRAEREREEFLQQANADLLRSLLPTLDGFDRALKRRDPKVPEQFYQGMELIYRQLSDTLRRAGLASVDSEGLTFDPAVHQAVETVESSKHRHHEVMEELQRGYKLKHRLLRPALVKVAVRSDAGGSAADKTQEPTEDDD